MLLFIIEVAAPVSMRQFIFLFSIVKVAMGNAEFEAIDENFQK